jgi:hypothetical protein
LFKLEYFGVIVLLLVNRESVEVTLVLQSDMITTEHVKVAKLLAREYIIVNLSVSQFTGSAI